MKIRLRDNKGQADVIGAISGFILLVVAIIVGLLILGELQESTVGDCILGYSTAVNSTSVDNGTEQLHQVALPNSLTDDDAEDGNVTITYTNSTDGGNCTAYIGANLIGTFTRSGPVIFDIDSTYFSNPLGFNFTSCVNQNVTLVNVTYYSLTSCDYTIDAYDAMDTTYDMNFTAMGLLPIIILVMAAVAIISAALALRRL